MDQTLISQNSISSYMHDQTFTSNSFFLHFFISPLLSLSLFIFLLHKGLPSTYQHHHHHSLGSTSCPIPFSWISPNPLHPRHVIFIVETKVYGFLSWNCGFLTSQLNSFCLCRFESGWLCFSWDWASSTTTKLEFHCLSALWPKASGYTWKCYDMHAPLFDSRS